MRQRGVRPSTQAPGVTTFANMWALRGWTVVVLLALGTFGCGGGTDDVSDSSPWPRVPAGGAGADGGEGDSDAGASADGGASSDAGHTLDGGRTLDGGAGSPDAGMALDGGITPPPPPPAQSCRGPLVRAQATFYAGDGARGACSVPLTFGNYAAVAAADYDVAAVCGACLEVTGPKGSTLVLVADRCPTCSGRNIDLSAASFSEIADLSAGIVDVGWRQVPCPVASGIEYRIDSGSNAYFLSFVVWNHRHPLRSVAIKPAGASTFTPLQREFHNTWAYSPGAPIPTPVTVRVTDVHGHTVEDALFDLTPGSVHRGSGQFPETCGP